MFENNLFRIYARSAGRNPLDPEAHVFAQSLANQAIYGRFLDMTPSGDLRPGIVCGFAWNASRQRLVLTVDTTRLSHRGMRLSAHEVAVNLQRYIHGKDNIVNLYALHSLSVASILHDSNEVCLNGISALTPVLRALTHPLIRIIPGGKLPDGEEPWGWGAYRIDGANMGILRLARTGCVNGLGPDNVEICTARGPYEFDFALWPVADNDTPSDGLQEVQIDSIAGTYCIVFNFRHPLIREGPLRRHLQKGLDLGAVVNCSTPGSRNTNLLIPRELIGNYEYNGYFDPDSIPSIRETVKSILGQQTGVASVYYGPKSSNTGRDKLFEVMEAIGLSVSLFGTVSNRFTPSDDSLFMIRNVCALRSDPFSMVAEFLRGSPCQAQIFPPSDAMTQLCDEYRHLDDLSAIDHQLQHISTLISKDSLLIPFAVRDVRGLIRSERGYRFVPNGNGIYCDLECFHRHDCGK